MKQGFYLVRDKQRQRYVRKSKEQQRMVEKLYKNQAKYINDREKREKGVKVKENETMSEGK